MKKIEMNGKVISTNKENKDFRVVSSNFINEREVKGWDCVTNFKHGEFIDELFDKCIEMGYTTIVFFYQTTSIRNYHELIALCKGGDN